jgi:hypothetical protein
LTFSVRSYPGIIAPLAMIPVLPLRTVSAVPKASS